MTPDPRAAALADLEKLNVVSTRRILEHLIAKAEEPPARFAWFKAFVGHRRIDTEEAR